MPEPGLSRSHHLKCSCVPLFPKLELQEYVARLLSSEGAANG